MAGINLDALIQELQLTNTSIATVEQVSKAQLAFRTQNMQGLKSIKIWGTIDPTVKTYTNEAGVTREALLDKQVTLELTKKDYFDGYVEKIDDYQAFSDRMQDWAIGGGKQFAQTIDKYAFKVFTTTTATYTPNEIADVTALDETNIRATVRAMGTKLSNQLAPTSNRKLFVDPDVASLIASDVALFNTNVGADALASGVVGRYLGFDVIETVNLPVSDQVGGHKKLIATVPEGNDMGIGIDEIGMKENKFTIDVYGLVNYGAVISQPAFTVIADVKLG